MHLKRIKLYGFKSFAQDAVLEFKPGITALVGPNGGGKSNVVDAVRWALGEQRLRDLRAERWEDLLHQGGGLRNPARMAEVILEFDNRDGEMAQWPESLSVARRYYRSGDSEYLIQGQVVRLKDVTDLFLDSGLGRFSYAIISQGRVEGALLQKPHERLEHLQEAAGVSRYKVRKKETLSHLQDTEAKSVRLKDLLDEVSRQMNEVRERARVESRYRLLEGRRVELQRRLDYTDYERAMAKQAKLHDELASLSLERTRLSEELSQLAAQAAHNRQVVEELGGHAEEDLEELKRLQVQTTQLRVLERQLQTQSTHIDEENQRIESALLLMRSQQQELAKEKQVQVADGIEPGRLQTRAEALNESLRVTALERKEMTLLLGSLEAKRTEIDRERRDMEQRLERLKGILGIVDGQSEVMAIVRKREQDRIRVQKSLEERAERVTTLENDRGLYRRNLNQVDAQLTELRRKIGSQEARLKALRQLEDDGEGLQSGVRAVLKASRQNQLSGLLGTLESLVQAPKDLTLAIQTALGGAAQDVVVTHEDAARKAVRFLKSASLGRATFLPLDTVRESRAAEQDSLALLRETGVLGWASDLVTFTEDIRPAVMHILGRVLVLESLDEATKLGRLHRFRYKMVTRDGQIVHAGGAITGGSATHQRHSTTGRKQEMADLTIQIEDGQRAIQQVEHDRSLVLESLELMDGQIDEVKDQLLTLRSEWEKVSRELEVHSQIGNPRILVESIEKKNHAIEAIVLQIEENKEALRIGAGAFEQLEQEASEAQREWQRKQQELREQQLIYDRIVQEERRVEQQVLTQSQRLQELSGERTRLVEELAEVAVLLKSLDVDETGRERERAQRLRQLTEQRERALKLDHRERALVSEDRKMENRENAWRQEILAITVRFEGFDHQENAEVLSRVEEETARREMQEIAHTLSELGPLVPGSLAVFEQLEEREKYLSQESRDVMEAHRELMGTLHEIDEEMERRVKDTAIRVEQAFQEACRQLYGGGDGGFSWISGEEGGVELWVQPPGNRKSHLSLLSGGEKALGGIAWLFSLLSARPSPFVILDEVEASLDEANTSRFAQYLRQARAGAQYVIVTHHRETMEVADALWGIAGDGRGQSRVISVLLEGAEELATS